MTDRRQQAEDVASELVAAFAPLGLMPSILEAETLAGRASGRVRIVLRAEDARDLAVALRRLGMTRALEA